ncbi:MAG TPA: general secretion pathway protein GspB [Burkholderiales bacterium]|nr:general secretion pathway protein GspB [Burkholderiales bacterium]
MSYILDALRKSDLQRQHGAAPTLQTSHIAPRDDRRPGYWIYGGLGALLIAAGVAIGWLRPWQAGQTAPATVPLAAGPPEPAPPQAATAPPLPAKSVLTPESSAPAPAGARPRTTAPVTTARANEAPVTPSAQTPTMPRTSPAVAATKVLAITELPPAIQQEIPPMAISVHAYSSRPADRIVGINDRLLREGGDVPPGLTLDEITPDGMIFSYKGYRFRRGVGAVDSR